MARIRWRLSLSCIRIQLSNIGPPYLRRQKSRASLEFCRPRAQFASLILSDLRCSFVVTLEYHAVCPQLIFVNHHATAKPLKAASSLPQLLLFSQDLVVLSRGPLVLGQFSTLSELGIAIRAQPDRHNILPV